MELKIQKRAHKERQRKKVACVYATIRFIYFCRLRKTHTSLPSQLCGIYHNAYTDRAANFVSQFKTNVLGFLSIKTEQYEHFLEMIRSWSADLSLRTKWRLEYRGRRRLLLSFGCGQQRSRHNILHSANIRFIHQMTMYIPIWALISELLLSHTIVSSPLVMPYRIVIWLLCAWIS